MSLEQLIELIKGGESLTVEFKREMNDKELVENIVCLANGEGGWLLIGVEDDGTVMGARPRHGSMTDSLRLQSLIQGRTNPRVVTEISIVAFEAKEIIAIRVPKMDRPVSTSTGKFLRRGLDFEGKPTCVPFHFHEMLSREASFGRLDYSALPVPEATWDDLNPLEFERARQIIRKYQGDKALLDLSEDDLAKALGAVVRQNGILRVTVAGLLLFGREESLRRYLPTHEAAFQVLAGTKVEVNDFFRLPLPHLSDEIFARFLARHREEEMMLGIFRVGVPDFEPGAFREAVHNALLHRDYTQLGAAHVQRLDDCIEISNPGGFVEGVRLDNLLVTQPKPRNPLLSDAFKRLGLVERTGRGIDSIFEGCLRYGRPAPDYCQSTETYVKVILPGGDAHLGFTRLVIEQNDRLQRSLRASELLILQEAWRERRVDTDRAAELIQQSHMQARKILEKLVEVGLIEAKGERRARVYHLSAGVYRAMGEPAAYIRSRGFEAIQMEQMILQYAKKHGRITRRETAELCRITGSQATRLLSKLVSQGHLVRQGQRKTVFYEYLS
jgi:ATP-dependent DNA helicase RecG